MERLRVSLALAYGVGLFLPLAHVFAHRAGANGGACVAALIDGPVLSPDCQGPCDDPTHHHHGRSRGHAHCLICQTHALSHALLLTGLSGLPATDAGHLVAAKWIALGSGPVLNSGSIRSPPPVA